MFDISLVFFQIFNSLRYIILGIYSFALYFKVIRQVRDLEHFKKE